MALLITLLLTACCVPFQFHPQRRPWPRNLALSGCCKAGLLVPLHGSDAAQSRIELTACCVGSLQGRPEEELATQILQCLPGSEAALLVPPSHQEQEWQDSAVELAGIAAKYEVEWGALNRWEASKALVLMSNMQASLTQPSQTR